jgi:hypothetical protein
MMWLAGLIETSEVRPSLGQLSPDSKASIGPVVRQYFQNAR